MKNETVARLQALMPVWQTRVERALDHWLPAASVHPSRLHEAMRYAVLGGGKRVRPILVYATGTALGITADTLDGPACAVELIHAYSLIHDDLPAMDNDDLRRGKPTCHRAFDEATAILAGDALHSLAFYILAHDSAMQVEAPSRSAMVETLALAAGSRGMVGGQAIDLAAVGRTLDIAELEGMHIHKTGALIRAAVKLAALSASQPDARTLHQLDHYAKCVGLAFQIRDDILDVEGDAALLGKRQGADLVLNKPTYPALLGLAEAKNRARQLHEESLASLTSLDERADPLRGLSHYLVDRAH
jgi:geranylgeranyl pyrophosphate synthase